MSGGYCEDGLVWVWVLVLEGVEVREGWGGSGMGGRAAMRRVRDREGGKEEFCLRLGWTPGKARKVQLELHVVRS